MLEPTLSTTLHYMSLILIYLLICLSWLFWAILAGPLEWLTSSLGTKILLWPPRWLFLPRMSPLLVESCGKRWLDCQFCDILLFGLYLVWWTRDDPIVPNRTFYFSDAKLCCFGLLDTERAPMASPILPLTLTSAPIPPAFGLNL